MGTWTDHFMEGLPVREPMAVGPVTEINQQGAPASSDTHRDASRFFFNRRHPETARVGFGDGAEGAAPSAPADTRRLRLARRRQPSAEELREAVRRRIDQQRRRFEREQEEALRRQQTPVVQRRRGSLFSQDDEHVVRELRPAGLPKSSPRLEAPKPAYEPPQAPARNGSHLDISA